MKEFWNTIQVIFAAVGGWLGYFLGGCDGLLYTLLAFVVLDYATGVMAAMTADVEQCFRAIIEDRPTPRLERMVDGRSGFLFLDKDCLPEVAMHWEHRFNHMVKRYNDIYRVQMPNITPHVCRHTYCSNQAKAGMNPKTLQYLMGHSDIGVTLNTYTHLGLEDAAEELRRMEEAEAARREQEKLAGKAKDAQKLFNAV